MKFMKQDSIFGMNPSTPETTAITFEDVWAKCNIKTICHTSFIIEIGSDQNSHASNKSTQGAK